MKVTKITVRAGRCVPHPLYDYGNLKADLELVAELEEGDDPDAVRQQLQEDIESQVEQHVADLREGILDLQAQTDRRERIKQLERDLAARNEELERIRTEFDDRPLLMPRGK